MGCCLGGEPAASARGNSSQPPMSVKTEPSPLEQEKSQQGSRASRALAPTNDSKMRRRNLGGTGEDKQAPRSHHDKRRPRKAELGPQSMDLPTANAPGNHLLTPPLPSPPTATLLPRPKLQKHQKNHQTTVHPRKSSPESPGRHEPSRGSAGCEGRMPVGQSVILIRVARMRPGFVGVHANHRSNRAPHL